MSQQSESLRDKIGHIIFESDSGLARAFDVALLVAIVISVLVVMAETVEPWATEHAGVLRRVEWFFTILFTAEYLLRVYSAYDPKRYMLSFYGVVDFLAILPTYLSLFIPNIHLFAVIRALRLLRMFRILKMARYIGEANTLMIALRASRAKITVFLYAVLTVVIILGTVMYLVEGREAGFSSIPMSIYWTVVTLTTVGYGDITPQSPLGRFIAGFIMILGYGIIAVPTGIVTAELTRHDETRGMKEKICRACNFKALYKEAAYCSRCGKKFDD